MPGKRKRLGLIDTLRGVTILSMVLYHAMWDMVFLKGADIPWYGKAPGFFWQQSICCSFIFLSGFCVLFSRRLFRRGAEVFAAGILVSLVTGLFLPENKILFGVLTLIGTSMLLMAGLEKKLFRKIGPVPGLLGSIILFCFLRGINRGFYGFLFLPLGQFPAGLYRGLPMTFLGFTDPAFFSTDYFSFFPWVLLFLCGYYCHRLLRKNNRMESDIWNREIPALSFLGRHSLLIYLTHQIVLYLLFMLL